MVHSDPKLAGIPVWGMTDVGAEPDNVGLQWLKIPKGSNALMRDGTRYADVANTHNYIQGHGSSAVTLEDNQVFWAESVDRGGTCAGCFDVYGEYWGGAGGSTGQGTWAKSYPINVLGQNQLPKVTTETGWSIFNTPSVSADMQGRLLTDAYLQAYRQGWSKTFIYLMFNNTSGDNGIWDVEWSRTPGTWLGRYVHNLTSILADSSSAFKPGRVNYSISGMPSTGYAMLMQKSSGKYELAIWGEAFASKTRRRLLSSWADLSGQGLRHYARLQHPLANQAASASVKLTLTDHAIIVEF